MIAIGCRTGRMPARRHRRERAPAPTFRIVGFILGKVCPGGSSPPSTRNKSFCTVSASPLRGVGSGAPDVHVLALAS